MMKQVTTRLALALGAASALAMLTGCATQQPVANYGHPALYAAQPVVVVQQPAQVVYAQPQYRHGGYYAAAPVYAPSPVYTQSYTTYPQPQSYAYAPGYAPAPARNDVGRTAVGALAGGVIGSQFGGSRNARTAATVVGAGAGAMVAQGGYSNEAVGGAVLGGIIGSRFGKGEGRNAAAAIGAGLGAWMAVQD
jgi:hypothetical protein